MKAPEVRPLYNQSGLKNAELVVLVGAKCTGPFGSMNVCATTAMNGGSAGWQNGLVAFYGKVIIWPDHDEPGDWITQRSQCGRPRWCRPCAYPEDPARKPQTWDAADAVAGLDIHAIIRIGNGWWPKTPAAAKNTSALQHRQNCNGTTAPSLTT